MEWKKQAGLRIAALQIFGFGFADGKNMIGMNQNRFISLQALGFYRIINGLQRFCGMIKQATVVLPFNIVHAHCFLLFFQQRVIQIGAGMKSLKQNRMFIRRQPFKQIRIDARTHNVGYPAHQAGINFLSRIIMDFSAVFFQLWCSLASVLKAVQLDFYSGFMKGFDFIKHIHHSSIVRGEWYIKGNDVQRRR